MAVCYITQLEIYPSNPQEDLLDIRKVDDAVNLLEDLNYIRSVIRAILGSDAKRWNDVDFVTAKNFTEIWKRLSEVSTTSTSTTVPTLPAAEYIVNGFIPTANFVTGEIMFSHVFNRRVFIDSPQFGHAFAEVAPQFISATIEGTTVTTFPDDVEFLVISNKEKIIGKFSFIKGSNKASFERIGPTVELLAGDMIKIVPLSTNFYNIENISFYMKFTTSEYIATAQGSTLDLYANVLNVNNVLSKEEYKEQLSGSYTFKLFEHKTINPFFIDKNQPGYVYVNKKPNSNYTLYIYKESGATTTQVGEINLLSTSNVGLISMTDVATNFTTNDTISVRAHNSTSSVPSVTFEGLNINFNTFYTVRNTKYDSGYFAFMPGTILDSKTIFSIVAHQKLIFNLSDSVFASTNFPAKFVDIDVYKNNLRVGSIQFSQEGRFAKNQVQDIQILNTGDCLYFKTLDNTTASDTTDIKDVSITLIPAVLAEIPEEN